MSQSGAPRTTDKIVGELLNAASAAAEIVARGQDAWDSDRLLRLAAEAVINRIGDASSKLPDEVRAAMPEAPWDDIRANRVLVAHISHRIDPKILWATLSQDVPQLQLRWSDGTLWSVLQRRGRRSALSEIPDSTSASDPSGSRPVQLTIAFSLVSEAVGPTEHNTNHFVLLGGSRISLVLRRQAHTLMTARPGSST